MAVQSSIQDGHEKVRKTELIHEIGFTFRGMYVLHISGSYSYLSFVSRVKHYTSSLWTLLHDQA